MTETNVELLDARIRVIQAIMALRYGASLTAAMPSANTEQTEAEFCDHLADWLIAFNGTLSDISDTTTNMAKELTELRSQRKAVRDFLGLTATQNKGE